MKLKSTVLFILLVSGITAGALAEDAAVEEAPSWTAQEIRFIDTSEEIVIPTVVTSQVIAKGSELKDSPCDACPNVAGLI